MEGYIQGEVPRTYAQTYLGIGKTRFFEVIKAYKENPQTFTTEYARTTSNRSIATEVETNLIKQLEQAKALIFDPAVPIYTYNYSYIRDVLSQDFGHSIAVSTIIKKAKDLGYYLPKRITKAHDREVLTNYPGELVQHDSSHHLFAPLAQEKWYLITTLDDHSRLLLYAKLFYAELSWNHIEALKYVFLTYGVPIKYYADSHSIFRFVRGRDTVGVKGTDEVVPQWKQVLIECGSTVTYALSPQAKGKIERPYRWLQDRLVRTCMRKNVATLPDAQAILDQEVARYNYKQVHTTTGEVPFYHFQRALQAKQSLFRSFSIPKPFSSVQDLFCFRTQRVVDAYHKISFNTLKFFIHIVPLYERVDLRITPDFSTNSANVHVWYKGVLTDRYSISFSDLKEFNFS